MTANNKIISLDPARKEQPGVGEGLPQEAEFSRLANGSATITRRMSAAAIELKELMDRYLGKQLQEMFDDVDDALFDMAENATNNQLQNVFFESMREVRFKRLEIEHDFLDVLQQDFTDLFSDAKSVQANSASMPFDGSADSLALMDEDAVEEMVAVDTMLARFEPIVAAPLAALEARLACLADVDISSFATGQRVNPVSLRRLCHSFSSACRVLSVDIKARIVLFKLFEKTVLSNLEEIYQQANEKLVRAQVLPDYRAVTSDKKSRSTGTSQPAAIQTSHLSERSMSALEARQTQELTQLLSSAPQFQARATCDLHTGSLSGALQQLTVSDYPVIGSEVLLQLLHALQCQSGGAAQQTPDARWLPELQTPKDLLVSLNNALACAADNGEYSIGQRERDVIGLVSLLFQSVLEDCVVAEPMKAAISRLQIPVIKVALNEANFFANPAHPARRMLNEMAHATVGWVEIEDYHKDPLYQLICGAVERVCSEYEQDIQIFADVMADLKSWVDAENKRAELRKNRLVDAESGRDESDKARTEIKAIVAERLYAGLPDFIGQMIENVWINILFLAYLQKGKKSEQWEGALEAMEQLLWTVAPSRSKDDRAEILSKLPDLLRSLRKGFELINHDASAVEAFFGQLEKTHMDVLQRQEPAVVTPTVLIESSELQSDNQKDDVAEGQLPAATHVDESCDIAGPCYEQAKAMAVGQWIELFEGDKKKRCRLVAILRNSGKRIFINRSGAKAGEFRVEEIAAHLEANTIVLLEDTRLFDKALSSVIDGLRQQQSDAASA